MQRAGKRLFQGADDEAAHQAAVAKAHLRLGRVHIDVDLMRIAGDEQRQRRMAAGGQKIHVSRPHRAEQQFVAHGAPVDEEILRRGAGAVPGRQAGEARKPEALPRRLDGERIGAEILAHDRAKP